MPTPPALVALFDRAAGLPKHDAFGGRPPVEYEALYELGA